MCHSGHCRKRVAAHTSFGRLGCRRKTDLFQDVPTAVLIGSWIIPRTWTKLQSAPTRCRRLPHTSRGPESGICEIAFQCSDTGCRTQGKSFCRATAERVSHCRWKAGAVHPTAKDDGSAFRDFGWQLVVLCWYRGVPSGPGHSHISTAADSVAWTSSWR